jgi:hypothetical protein
MKNKIDKNKLASLPTVEDMFVAEHGEKGTL